MEFIMSIINQLVELVKSILIKYGVIKPEEPSEDTDAE